jgi:Na+/proline symporter
MSSITALGAVDLGIVIGFLVIVTIVGFVMSNVASDDIESYFLGDNDIPWWVLGISTSTSNFDMAGTMLIVALVYSLGYKGFIVELRGGVGLTLAFLMVFLGKWLRRSQVMTSAEWMKLRFGTDKQGRVAHIVSTVAYVVLMVGMIAYFAEGAGQFLEAFLPFSELTCTALMVGVGLVYTLMSGIYGVVFTDVIQMVILTFTALYVTIHAFTVTPTVSLPEGFLAFDLASPQTEGAEAFLGTSVFHMFGIAVFAWLARTTMEGMGGVGGYVDQRFFAARSEREASLLTLESIVLSLFRWTLVAGLVVMAIGMVQEGAAGTAAIQQNPENALPVVLGQLLPVGVKGIVISGLLAAAMSTFDSTLNAGASYIVKDIYQSYIEPDASQQQLVWMSRLSTALMCLAGVLLAVSIPNIRSIWGIITMGLGPGLFVPLFLRWYWPRLNGYGFAAGTGVGTVAGIVVAVFFELPVYEEFPIIVGSSLLATIVGTYSAPKTRDEILLSFWLQINPWGTWGEYRKKAVDEGIISEKEGMRRTMEQLNDLISLVFAIPFQLALLVGGMAFVFHDWKKFAFCMAVVILTSVGLYFFWYRNLRTAEEAEGRHSYVEEHSPVFEKSSSEATEA